LQGPHRRYPCGHQRPAGRLPAARRGRQ